MAIGPTSQLANQGGGVGCCSYQPGSLDPGDLDRAGVAQTLVLESRGLQPLHGTTQALPPLRAKQLHSSGMETGAPLHVLDPPGSGFLPPHHFLLPSAGWDSPFLLPGPCPGPSSSFSWARAFPGGPGWTTVFTPHLTPRPPTSAENSHGWKRQGQALCPPYCQPHIQTGILDKEHRDSQRPPSRS